MDEGLPPNLLRTVVEHMDQGVLVVGADNRIVHSNRRLRDLLGVEGDALRVGGDVEAPWREMVERGEYARADPVPAAWGRSGSIERHPTVSERQRPDGTILEIRAMPLPDGGVVRTFADITRRRELEDGAREDRERLRLIAENTGDIVVLCDLDGTKRYVSPAVLPMLGFTPLEYGAATIGAHVHPDDAEEVAKTMASLAGGTCDRATCRYRHRTEDGGYRWVEASCQLIREAHDARPTGWVTALRDISARVEAEERTRISEQRLALDLASEGDGLWDFDLRTRRITFTGRWLDLLGYGEGRNRPTREEWRALTHPDDVDLVEQALDRHIAGRTPSLDFEYRVRGAGGGYIWNHVRGRVVEWDGDGEPVRLVGTNSDVTARKRADALISHMARHDAVTGLANRIPLHERLALEIGALEHGGRFAVLAGDLDRFKAINDSLGHAAGDELLRAAPTRLAALVGDGDLVARLGGDEFAIVLGGRDAPDAIAAADRIIAAMAEPFDLAGRETSVGISLGMAALDRGERDLTGEEVLRRADVALYAAKAAGRNACEPFRAGMDAALLARSALERDLRDAAARGEFALAYQPIFEAGDRAVLGFEALLRWRHPRRGIVQPGDFIHLAEEAGSIVAIGEWAIGEACR